MSEPIKVGDLVQVVHACCEETAPALGHVFTVGAIATPKGGAFLCPKCGDFRKDQKVIALEATAEVDHSPMSYLKRIPPLDELERTKIVKELTA